MSFLQPLLLAALPLISLPIIIHLINQRRYQTRQWAAMMFLLAANRMSRGYARLRQWLILAARVLAIAGLIFAISRPLASGWFGSVAGGKADTTIVILDRSPSMQQQGTGTVESKLATGRQQLASALGTLGSDRWVLIDSASNSPREIESPDSIPTSPDTDPTSAAADLPAMLQSALEYVKANQSGRTEVWICSDLRANDWDAEGGRWAMLRDSFLELNQGVRFHLLAYAEPAQRNLSIRVTDVRRIQSGDITELLISLVVSRHDTSEDSLNIPLQFEIEGARSEFTIEMAGPQYELKDHRIALEGNRERGWGRVSIPADTNAADNDFYFVFDKPLPRRTIIVTDDPAAATPLQLAASITPDPSVECIADVITVDQLATADWDHAALLLWQAPLPRAEAVPLVNTFVERGGRAIFWPPRSPTSDTFLGVKWESWSDLKDVAVDTWRSDEDLLARTQSGAALPVGQLQIRRLCGLAGEFTPLASLKNGAPLLARVTTKSGGVYFCATTPAPVDSSLATDGVVLYVAVQRAMLEGADVLRGTRQLIAGAPPAAYASQWERLSNQNEGLSTQYSYHRGVYSTDDRLLAVNRDVKEEQSSVLADQRVADLFRGLDFSRVNDTAGNMQSLIQEIWRAFLATMLFAMVCEAGLCLPKVRAAEGTAR